MSRKNNHWIIMLSLKKRLPEDNAERIFQPAEEVMQHVHFPAKLNSGV